MTSVKTMTKVTRLPDTLNNRLDYDFDQYRKLLINCKQKSSGEQHPEVTVEFYIQRTNPNVNK